MPTIRSLVPIIEDFRPLDASTGGAFVPAHWPAPGRSDVAAISPDPVIPKPPGAASDLHGENILLLARIANRDTVAFEQLYDNVVATMFALVLRIVGSRPEAEDVLQVGFAQIWLRAANYQANLGSPSAWIATIMRRKAIDALRARTTHLARIRTAFFRRAEETETSNGGDHLALREEHHAMRHALTQLAKPERHTIELAFFEGLTHVEIAEAQGAPVGTVKARIRRGMQKLRLTLDNLADAAVAC